MADAVDAATEVALQRGDFTDAGRVILRHGGLTATLFRYSTGIEALRIANARGHVTVLPYMGQMVWRAAFDGVELSMQSMFDEPRPARTIVETYGCLAFHAGLLRNGVPGAEDTHVLHGEMPCMPMDRAGLRCGADESGVFMSVTGLRDYAMGFGAHYRATPRVTLREHATRFDIVMDVENRSAAAMDLMYLAHVNFAFEEGARIIQPVPFDPLHVVTRTAIPSHVAPSDAFRTFLAYLADNPARMEVLDEPGRYDPEQVFYIKGLRPEPDGLVRFMLSRQQGDGFCIAYDPVAMPHTIRWVLANSDQRVAAFAMPATCEPEGHAAETRKGNVRSLAGGARATFATQVGYLDAAAAGEMAARIGRHGQGR